MSSSERNMPEFSDRALDREIQRAEVDVEATRDYLLTLQDERAHRWYMRNVIIVDEI